MEGPLSRRATLAWIVLYLAMSGWAMHWLWGPELAPGMDTTGHLVRLDTAFELFRHGRLDGWMDRSMLGYQLHLVYGPGFAIIAALIKALSFGTFSTALVYKLIGFLAITAIPFTGMALSRSLGLSPQAAWISGLFMLTVSSFNGSGIEGAFLTGLVPQQVGTAMVLGAWALLIAQKPRTLLLGILVAALACTHPYSLLMFIYFSPFVLLTAHIRDRSLNRGHISTSAIIALILSAFWWIPALAARDLRGPMAGWPSPGFWGRLEMLVTGERGIGVPASLILAVAIVWLLFDSLKRQRFSNLSLVILPLAALAFISWLAFLLQDQMAEAVQAPDRAFPFMVYLLIPVVGIAIAPFKERGVAVAMAAVMLATATLVAPNFSRYRPEEPLLAIIADVADVVPNGYRYAVGNMPRQGFGVAEPRRYIGWKANVSDLSDFGAEWSPGSEVSYEMLAPLDKTNVDDRLELIASSRVSHIVSGNTATRNLFSNRADLRKISEHGELTLWEITTRQQVEIIGASTNQLNLRIHTELDNQLSNSSSLQNVDLPISYSPGWQSPGFQLGRAENGRLSIQVPNGTTTITLHWQLPRIHTVAWLVSFIGIAIFTIFWTQPNQIIRRHRQQASYEGTNHTS